MQIRPWLRWWVGLAALGIFGVARALSVASDPLRGAEQTSLMGAPLPMKPSGRQIQAQGWGSKLGAVDPVPWLDSVQDRKAFDRMARSVGISHLLFLIDRSRGDKVHFINTRRYAFHEDFIKAQLGLPGVSRQALDDNYRSPQRRFLMGTLGWQPLVRQWSFEFWEGDRLTPDLLALAQKTLSAKFFEPVVFKANSNDHEALGRLSGQAFLTLNQLLAGQNVVSMNAGKAQGRLRIVRDVADLNDLEPHNIVLLHGVPLAIPPVAGLVTSEPSTILSHVNLLVKGWGIPSVYVRDAVTSIEPLAGNWVELSVNRQGYTLQVVPQPPMGSVQGVGNDRVWPQPKVVALPLFPLSRLRAVDRQHCGSKAANLGELNHAILIGRLKGVAPIPDGFCIPFSAFVEFMASPAAREAVAKAEKTPGFSSDRRVRVAALQELRDTLVSLPVPAATATSWLAQWASQLGRGGVFVRSSSNSEDLPQFSGAGLYSTVPNVLREQDLEQAVKTVWASVFNAEAYEARRWAHMPHDRVIMGVFVQRAVSAQSSGVMVTANPLDPLERGVCFISAKRGLGIRVVEGHRVAEQVLFRERANAIQVLTRSDDDLALLLDEKGGVREEPVEKDRAVLTDDLVRRLARVGSQIKSVFGGKDQDIEWAADAKGVLYLLQARPFVDLSVERMAIRK